MAPMYVTPKPYAWHTIQPVAYTAQPQFKPPTPPPVFVPQNPFLVPLDSPEDDAPPESEAPAVEEPPPPDAGVYALL